MTTTTNQRLRSSAYTLTAAVEGLEEANEPSQWIAVGAAGFKRIDLFLTATGLPPGGMFSVPMEGSFAPDGLGVALIDPSLTSYDPAEIRNGIPVMGAMVLVPNYVRVMPHGEAGVVASLLLNLSR